MKNETYPLVLSPDLLGEARQTAKEAGLSLDDALRQDLKRGLPKLREQLATPPPKAFTPEEVSEAFAPDPEWDAVTAAMSRLPIPRIQE